MHIRVFCVLPIAMCLVFSACAWGVVGNDVLASYAVVYGISRTSIPKTNDDEPIVNAASIATKSTQGNYSDALGNGDWNTNSYTTPGLMHLTTSVETAGDGGFVDATAGGQTDDSLTVTGTTAGDLRITDILIGEITNSMAVSNSIYTDTMTVHVTALDVNQDSTETQTITESYSSTSDPSDTNSGPILDHVNPGDTILLTASATLDSVVEALETDEGLPGYASTDADFGDTAMLVVESETPGLSFTSASGYSYADVPEPMAIIFAFAPYVLLRRRDLF